ncbi:MAG TPA: transporter [Vicinamibacterales bacterium]|nr:transporter [Vicinamibacterales bacterium]
MRLKLATGVAILAEMLVAAPAWAQLNGENLLGDMGVQSGTQPAPGFYASFIYYRYAASSLKGPDGRSRALDPTGTGSQTINAAVPLFYYVRPAKVLGANFGMMAVVPTASGALEAPGFGLSEEASYGLSDLYVMPAQLGWHFRRADVTAGFAFFAPTGRYAAGASDNLGKGMWSYELSGGGTVYFDRARSVSVSTMAYWETHTAKEGQVRAGTVTLDDVKVGDLLTLEGGIGKSFLHGAASVGAAYYAQWKVTPDELGVSVPAVGSVPGHRVWAIGPDVTIPIATRTRLMSLVNVRYLFEQGARMKTQGNTLLITGTIPVGGIKIPEKPGSGLALTYEKPVSHCGLHPYAAARPDPSRVPSRVLPQAVDTIPRQSQQ